MRRWWWLVALLCAATPDVDAGDAAFRAGDVAGALVAWSRAYAELRPGDPAVFELALKLAAAHREAGAPLRAMALLEQAEAVAAPAERARVDVARATVLRARGLLAASAEAADAAFADARAVGDVDVAALAAVEGGAARLRLRDAVGAALRYERAVTLYDTLGDVAAADDARVGLAAARVEQGRLVEAARALVPALRSGDPETRARAERVRGDVAVSVGRDDEAVADYGRALDATTHAPTRADLLVRRGEARHRLGDAGAADDLGAAAGVWDSLGRPAPGARLRARALAWRADVAALDRTARDPRSSAGARFEAEVALARAALDRGDVDAARAHASGATALAAQLDHPDDAVVADSVAALAAAAAEAPDARSRLDAVAATIGLRRLAGAPALPDDDAVLLARLAAATDAPASAWVAADAAFVAADEPVIADGAVAARVAEAAALAEAPLEDAAAVARRAELRVAFAAEVDALRAGQTDLDSRAAVAPEALEALQRELPVGARVIAPIVLPDRVVVLTLDRDAMAVRTSPIAPDEVLRLASRASRALRAGLRTSDVERTLDQLGAALLSPVAADLAGAEVVVVAATGPLRSLPWAALRLDGAYLSEHHDVAAITHAGSLGLLRAAPAPVDGPALLVGDPDGTLPAAAVEVAAIARRRPGSDVLVGSAATRDAVLSAARGKHVVHLATHGRVDAEVPARSHLVLAPPGPDLTYREIPGFAPDLSDARLVVLSACDSGRPIDAVEPGVAAIAGLGAQFQRAGVESLVGTLWPVRDDATRAWMEAFYAALDEGRSLGAAARAAHQRLRDDPETAHPADWAAFTLVGDWR